MRDYGNNKDAIEVGLWLQKITQATIVNFVLQWKYLGANIVRMKAGAAPTAYTRPKPELLILKNTKNMKH